jgi:hypothetical protein
MMTSVLARSSPLPECDAAGEPRQQLWPSLLRATRQCAAPREQRPARAVQFPRASGHWQLSICRPVASALATHPPPLDFATRPLSRRQPSNPLELGSSAGAAPEPDRRQGVARELRQPRAAVAQAGGHLRGEHLRRVPARCDAGYGCAMCWPWLRMLHPGLERGVATRRLLRAPHHPAAAPSRRAASESEDAGCVRRPNCTRRVYRGAGGSRQPGI